MNRKLTNTPEKDKLVPETHTPAQEETSGGELSQSLAENLALASSATKVVEATELHKRNQSTEKPS